jgi:glycosyltransferase involved in cell wall biosynthesis
MRIAFLTLEYPTESPDAGGLATYVRRMAQLLLESGHDPEVFVTSADRSQTARDGEILVHKVNWAECYKRSASFYQGMKSIVRSNIWNLSVPWLLQARALATALDRRHALYPFQLVQSTNYQGAGLFVSRLSGRVHVVRCSSSADLYNEYDGLQSRAESLRGYFERRVMRSADDVYAPSQYLADYFRRSYQIDVQVLRPPKYLEQVPATKLQVPLPQRFFLHYGQLLKRKGSDLLARALALAWSEVPDLTMVWSGRCWDDDMLANWRALWGERAKQIHVTGPLPRSQIYAVLQRAEAAVLPSQVDNLPNTVIESLMLGIPVLGTRGASIDELVEENVTGHLVEPGDMQGLGAALIRMWTGQTPVKKGFLWQSKITEDMKPERAIANLISLAARNPRPRSLLSDRNFETHQVGA